MMSAISGNKKKLINAQSSSSNNVFEMINKMVFLLSRFCKPKLSAAETMPKTGMPVKRAIWLLEVTTGFIWLDFDSAYRTTTNLNDIDSYSTGVTWNNDWSNIVVWGVCNKSGEVSHLMVNLPSDGYN